MCVCVYVCACVYVCVPLCVGEGVGEDYTKRGWGVFERRGGLNSSTNYGLFYKICSAGKKDQDFTERKTVEIVLQHYPGYYKLHKLVSILAAEQWGRFSVKMGLN